MVDQPILKSCYFKSPLSVFFVFYVFGHERKFVQAWDTEKNSERWGQVVVGDFRME